MPNPMQSTETWVRSVLKSSKICCCWEDCSRMFASSSRLKLRSVWFQTRSLRVAGSKRGALSTDGLDFLFTLREVFCASRSLRSIQGSDVLMADRLLYHGGRFPFI